MIVVRMTVMGRKRALVKPTSMLTARMVLMSVVKTSLNSSSSTEKEGAGAVAQTVADSKECECLAAMGNPP